VDETIEILTGVPAGVAEAGGQYPGDTVHGRVAARLDVLGRNLKDRDKQDEEDQDPPDPFSCQACH
jgi:hypothetical protein